MHGSEWSVGPRSSGRVGRSAAMMGGRGSRSGRHTQVDIILEEDSQRRNRP